MLRLMSYKSCLANIFAQVITNIQLHTIPTALAIITNLSLERLMDPN